MLLTQIWYYTTLHSIHLSRVYLPKLIYNATQSPYNPGGYKAASEINSAADLPYISKSDLLVSKLISCTERTEQPKADKDAKDAYQVVLNDANQGGISLTAAQKQAILDSQNNAQCIDLVCDSTCTSKKWWNKQLGLQLEE